MNFYQQLNKARVYLMEEVGNLHSEVVDAATGGGQDDTELSDVADQVLGQNDTTGDVSKELKQRQEVAKAEKEKQRKVIRPQMDEIEDQLGDVQQGIDLDKELVDKRARRIGSLDDQLAGVDQLLNDLERSF